jgi:hypothetical protein
LSLEVHAVRMGLVSPVSFLHQEKTGVPWNQLVVPWPPFKLGGLGSILGGRGITDVNDTWHAHTWTINNTPIKKSSFPY